MHHEVTRHHMLHAQRAHDRCDEFDHHMVCMNSMHHDLLVVCLAFVCVMTTRMHVRACMSHAWRGSIHAVVHAACVHVAHVHIAQSIILSHRA